MKSITQRSKVIPVFKTALFLCSFIFLFDLAEGQTKVIRGKVTTLNDLRVANIDVISKNSKSSVKTDSIGEYFIVCGEKDVLTFKGKVFRSKRVKITASTVDSVNVKLYFIASEKNNDIAVGYGYITKDDMTAAVSYMDNHNEDFAQFSNIFELIKGRFPGVQVVGGGSEPEVIIRGLSSIMLSSCALYVVNGQVVNSISSISPSHVKSINVIKDGSASIYGSRGANGVVVIETIKGPDND